MKSWQVEGEVIDKTPHDWDAERGEEIACWLGDHPVESFVIIDDDKDMRKMMPFLVKTKFEFGLTAGDAARAARLFKDTKTQSMKTWVPCR
jgi:PIN domain nuclease of toxin-antitoxin system